MEFIQGPTSFGLLHCLITHTGCPTHPPGFCLHASQNSRISPCFSKLPLVFCPISTFFYPRYPCFLRHHFFVQPPLPSGAQGASAFQISVAWAEPLPWSVPLAVLSHPSALIPCSTVFSPGILKTCSQPSEAGTSQGAGSCRRVEQSGTSLQPHARSGICCVLHWSHLSPVTEWGDLHPSSLGCLSFPSTAPAIHTLCSAALCASVGLEGRVTPLRGVVALWHVHCLACLGAGWIHCNGRAQHLPNLDTPLVLMKHNKTLCHRSDLSFTVVHLVSHR